MLFAASGAAPPDPASWIATAARALQEVIAAWWPALILAAAATVAMARLAIGLVHRARRREAARALWIQITPPAAMPTDGARALWLAVSGLLSRRRRGLRPARVSVEFVADSSGTRVGVWVPPTLSASAVAALIQRCWPGARTAVTGPNPHPDGDADHIAGVSVLARGGPWAPLLDSTHRSPAGAGSLDPLHGMLAALADLRGPDQLRVQLIITSAAIPHAHGDRDQPWPRRILIGLLRCPFTAALALVDLVLPQHSTTQPKASQRAENPARAAWQKAVATKQARAPHLHATLRIVCRSPGTTAHRRALISGVLNGYDLAAPAARLHSRTLRHAHDALLCRTPGRRRDRLWITVEEATALWHLPAGPAQYGMNDATARVRRPRRDLPTYRPHQPSEPTRGGAG